MTLHLNVRFLALAVVVLFLASCSMGPTDFSRVVARADGSSSETKFTSAGVSILTKNQYEATDVAKGEFRASHKVYGKDEVALPRYQAWGDVGVAGANALEGVTETVVEGVTQ